MLSLLRAGSFYKNFLRGQRFLSKKDLNMKKNTYFCTRI